MTTARVFKNSSLFQPSDSEPVRNVISESEYAVVARHVKTGQKIAAGDVVIAYSGQMHGVVNHAQEPLTFISVVSADAGYQLLEAQ